MAANWYFLEIANHRFGHRRVEGCRGCGSLNLLRKIIQLSIFNETNRFLAKGLRITEVIIRMSDHAGRGCHEQCDGKSDYALQRDDQHRMHEVPRISDDAFFPKAWRLRLC